jgi:hypothetical protein
VRATHLFFSNLGFLTAEAIFFLKQQIAGSFFFLKQHTISQLNYRSHFRTHSRISKLLPVHPVLCPQTQPRNQQTNIFTRKKLLAVLQFLRALNICKAISEIVETELNNQAIHSTPEKQKKKKTFCLDSCWL